MKDRMRMWFCNYGCTIPLTCGGAEAFADELLAGFSRKGWGCEWFGSFQTLSIAHNMSIVDVMKALTRRGVQYSFRDVKLPRRLLDGSFEVSTNRSFHFDTGAGVKVHLHELGRESLEAIERRFVEERPNLVLTQLLGSFNVVSSAIDKGIPVIFFIHNWTDEYRCIDTLATLKKFRNQLRQVFVPSPFIQKRIAKDLEVETRIMPPILRLAPALHLERNPEFVLFINPIPIKGLDIALKLANRFRNLKFLFLENWSDVRTTLELYHPLPPNVTLSKSVSPSEMEDIYLKTALLLFPSRCDEAFGRAIIEAQSHGVPVIASNRGAIPDTLGEGGVLMDAGASIEAWSRALLEVMGNSSRYAELAYAAKENSERYLSETARRQVLEDPVWK